MDEAARCRSAAGDAVRDIDPPALRRTIENSLDEGSMMPGALAIVTAKAASATEPDLESVAQRAAGVQLIYDGLRSIRELAREEPWAGIGADATGDQDMEDVDEKLTESNLAVLAADVAVSRGFYLLARTDAAGKAVETVRDFGHDQTVAGDSDSHDVNLEVDVLELAVIAGATAVGVDPTAELLTEAAELARRAGSPFPPADSVLPDPSDFGGDTDARAGATDGGTRTTATDP